MEIVSIRVMRRIVTGKYEHVELELEATTDANDDVAAVMREMDCTILNHVGKVV